MEIFAFLLCFVVFGLFIVTTDFKKNKLTNTILIILCVSIISTMGYAAFCMEPMPKSNYVAPTENPLDEINDTLDKIEKKLP